ncbi:regulatory protein RecX [Flavobacterium sp.]|uniref:regulatory protein RecX n=1 Tax=Flavobacterium sp. TaxID=239 RepID=UPI002FD8D677
MNEKQLSIPEIQTKLEYYCSYQERCHLDILAKLKQLNVKKPDTDIVIVHLIENDFLNEERFARAFARGKHRIKSWGKNRIINELKQRQIAPPNIKLALTEIAEEEYWETFEKLAQRFWESLLEKNQLKKRKKFCDYLLRKGWESELVYEKVKELENAI